MAYKFMLLSKVKEKEPDMRRLKVSEVARSPRGFLTAYKKAGSPEKLSEVWRNKRAGRGNGYPQRISTAGLNHAHCQKVLSPMAQSTYRAGLRQRPSRLSAVEKCRPVSKWTWGLRTSTSRMGKVSSSQVVGLCSISH